MFIEKRLVCLINKRDEIFRIHLNGRSWAELCNYPEERAWYCENLMQIDREIVDLANKIIKTHFFPCKELKDIKDVYVNAYIDKIYKKFNKQPDIQK